jgi:hypothetical protein
VTVPGILWRQNSGAAPDQEMLLMSLAVSSPPVVELEIFSPLASDAAAALAAGFTAAVFEFLSKR